MVEAADTAVESRDTKPLRVGLDIGSTTVKAVVLDQTDALDGVLFSDYRRHHANVRATVAGLLEDIHKELVARDRGDEPIRLAITGSGGLALADNLHVPFVQEVIAETRAIDQEYPQADVIIELGGEDAKITYLKPTPEQRMNGSCAGGTGAFIDQMATLLDTDGFAMRRIRQNRFAAAHQRWRGEARSGRLHLHRRGHTDHRRPGFRPTDSRHRDLSWRAALLHV